MDIIISNAGDQPIYEQIYTQIRDQILSEKLKEGEPLPSIRGLAKDLRISVITTKRAYEELEKEGRVRSVAGKGLYVCEYNTDYLREKQLMMLEKRLAEVIYEAKKAGLECAEFLEMAQTLYGEE